MRQNSVFVRDCVRLRRTRPPALDWFTISQVDDGTFALTEDGHLGACALLSLRG